MRNFLTSAVLTCALLTSPGISAQQSDDINIIPVSLRSGIESQISLRWPLADSQLIFSSKYFLADKKLAAMAGLDLSKHLSQYKVAQYNQSNKNIFLLFYNLVAAPTCNRDYMIQKVRLDKYAYDQNGNLTSLNNLHLVEIMKLNSEKRLKRADRHVRRYSLQNNHKRRVVLEVEIGCGTIPGLVESRRWPYRPGILYKLVQDYSINPGLYNHVQFENSKSYGMEFEFDAHGNHEVNWPSFLTN